jgi:hypothetical protein
MRSVAARPLATVLLLAVAGLAAVALAGCGKGGSEQLGSAGPGRQLAPVAPQGAISVATRNTTRLGGPAVATDAAAVARAVYPGLTVATRPLVAVLVNESAWLPALAASVLASAPVGAPILFSEGDTLPTVTRQTLEAMRPLGAPALGGAQVIRVGTTAAVPDGYITRSVQVGAAASSAAAIEQLAQTLGAGAPHAAIVLPAGGVRALLMPAAGLAALSGAPLLFVTGTGVPAATATVLGALHRPSIYVIDAAAIGARTLATLGKLGSVRTITSGRPTPDGEAAAENAIEIARYTNGNFGWGVKEPGHGLVFANASRPLDGPASALLSSTGDYGPQLLLQSARQVPLKLAAYLSDIQPAYDSPQFPPVRGAYNRGWLIGNEEAISAVTQAELDSVLEIRPQVHTSEEPSVSQVE